jgi:hypothetical protein
MEALATAATGREKNLVQRKNERTHLTPTGLLMEGDYTQNLVLAPFDFHKHSALPPDALDCTHAEPTPADREGISSPGHRRV